MATTDSFRPLVVGLKVSNPVTASEAENLAQKKLSTLDSATLKVTQENKEIQQMLEKIIDFIHKGNAIAADELETVLKQFRKCSFLPLMLPSAYAEEKNIVKHPEWFGSVLLDKQKIPMGVLPVLLNTTESIKILLCSPMVLSSITKGNLADPDFKWSLEGDVWGVPTEYAKPLWEGTSSDQSSIILERIRKDRGKMYEQIADLDKKGEYEKAMQLCYQILKYDKGDTVAALLARTIRPKMPRGTEQTESPQDICNRASRALKNGEFGLAVNLCNRAIKIEGIFACRAYMLKAQGYLGMNNFKQATSALFHAETFAFIEGIPERDVQELHMECYNRWLAKLTPSEPKETAEALYGRGRTFASLGEYEKAAADWKKSLECGESNDQKNTLRALADLRASCPRAESRNGSEAVEYAQKLLELSDPNDHQLTFSILAAAHAEAGNFSEAIGFQTDALKLIIDPAHYQHKEYSRRLDLYKDRRPYHKSASESH